MTILPTLAIAFRFWSRIITTANRKLWWDDWLALLAWVSAILARRMSQIIVTRAH